jgi:hypothetical protein
VVASPISWEGQAAGPFTRDRPLEDFPRWGFWKLFDRMRVDSRRWNHML